MVQRDLRLVGLASLSQGKVIEQFAIKNREHQGINDDISLEEERNGPIKCEEEDVAKSLLMA
jgi:hypothetical protein